MGFNTVIGSSGSDKVNTAVLNQIHVDGVFVKTTPMGTTPNVVYRIGDGTVHPEGWDNVLDNEYLDFYISFTSDADFAYISLVGANILDVTTVATNITNVLSVAGISGDVTTVAGISTQIISLALIQAKIESLYADKATLDSLYADKLTLDGLFASKTAIDSLYSIKAKLDSLYADKAKLDSIFADKTKLDSLYTDKITLDSLYADKAKLDSLYADKTKLDAIYSALANINIVANGIADVNNFASTYYFSLATAPTIGTHPTLSSGDLYFDTVLDEMRVYNGTIWKTSSDSYTKSESDARLPININAATAKTTPVDNDEFAITDSAAAFGLKKLTWANLKATLKTYFDTIYATLASPAFTGTPTAPTAVAGTDTTQLATTANVYASSLGWGQTWQDVTVSRVVGTTYTNSTGKPILVMIEIAGTSATITLTFNVNGVSLFSIVGGYPDQVKTILIPNGVTYAIATLSGTTLQKWTELR